MKQNLPPVIKLCERLLVDIELAVRRFARFHKYTFGSDLRTQAMNVTRLAYDDFVIVHSDREQLEQWQEQIVEFLRVELRLELKDDIRLRSLRDGIDFLGYVVYPTHTRVRRRVVRHAFAALSALSRPRCVEQFQKRRSVLASYLGHFKHANASKLSVLLESSQWPTIPFT